MYLSKNSFIFPKIIVLQTFLTYLIYTPVYAVQFYSVQCTVYSSLKNALESGKLLF